MKVVFHEDFYRVYTGDPAAAAGRMEVIVEAVEPHVTFVEAQPASRRQIGAVHSDMHVQGVEDEGLYDIAALAAGGAIQAAEIGLAEPCFGLVRPPGHHASAGSAWGFCFFNNIAVALEAMRHQQKIQTACVLDIDLHYGDGTVNILDRRNWVTVINMEGFDRHRYIQEVAEAMGNCRTDLIGISAGFDNHVEDWGGLLHTEDYEHIGHLVRMASDSCGGGCFAVLEGGYNHEVLGDNTLALIEGMRKGG